MHENTLFEAENDAEALLRRRFAPEGIIHGPVFPIGKDRMSFLRARSAIVCFSGFFGVQKSICAFETLRHGACNLEHRML